jgi:predicted RNA-binding Zn-ribbon protein involved in translation (DUF1610 family)
LLKDIDSYLKSIDINSWEITPKPPKGKGKQTYYVLSFIRTSEILKLIDFMYKDAHIYLERKANRCKQYKPINKVLDRNIICPRCGSNNIKRNGTRGNSVRYRCECGRGFSIKNSFN